MARRSGLATQAPREITWVIALILWVIGAAHLVLHVISMPDLYAIWALVIAGLLLLLGTMIKGL